MGQLYPDEISGKLRIQYVYRDDALELQSAFPILSDAVLKVLRYRNLTYDVEYLFRDF